MKTQRKMWDAVDEEGNDKYTLVTLYYNKDEETQTNIANSVEYEKFEHVDQTDDPAIIDSLDDILDEIEAHPCELNEMTKNFEIVRCWDGCSICK